TPSPVRVAEVSLPFCIDLSISDFGCGLSCSRACALMFPTPAILYHLHRFHADRDGGPASALSPQQLLDGTHQDFLHVGRDVGSRGAGFVTALFVRDGSADVP